MSEIAAPKPEQLVLADRLHSHWMLDEMLVSELSVGISAKGAEDISQITSWLDERPSVVAARDRNRATVTEIFQAQSDKQLIIIGPCSIDMDTDYAELFDYIEELQIEHPDAIIGFRCNGSKPRTGRGTTGLFSKLGDEHRERLIKVYQEAAERGIPIFAEITDQNEFSALAPYLTCAWLGARDMASTALRKLFSATRLPVMVKNGLTEELDSLENAVITIRSSSADNDNTGVDVGFIGHSYTHNGMPVALSVGEGNQNVAVIARGYDLPKSMKPKDRDRASAEHLSEVCALAHRIGCVALLDGSHAVPRMLAVDKIEGETDTNRLLKVLKFFRSQAKSGNILHVERVQGLLAEVSSNRGATDPNLIIDDANKKVLKNEIRALKKLLKVGTALLRCAEVEV